MFDFINRIAALPHQTGPPGCCMMVMGAQILTSGNYYNALIYFFIAHTVVITLRHMPILLLKKPAMVYLSFVSIIKISLYYKWQKNLNEGAKMYFSDMTIFTFQVTAALMMGWDYLMPAKWRDKINDKLRSRFANLQNNVDNKMITFIRDVMLSYKIIIASIIMIILGLTIIANLNFLIKFRSPLLIFIISSIGAITLALGGLFITNLISNIITHFFASGIIPRILLTFLLMTEKGPFAGMGFIILLISFFMRYQNIVHQPIK